MKTIWKYTFTPSGKNELLLPIGAKILCVKNQRESICLWAEVSPGEELEKRVFYIFGTGFNLVEKTLFYIGSVSMQEGTFIFHIYEEIK